MKKQMILQLVEVFLQQNHETFKLNSGWYNKDIAKEKTINVEIKKKDVFITIELISAFIIPMWFSFHWSMLLATSLSQLKRKITQLHHYIIYRSCCAVIIIVPDWGHTFDPVSCFIISYRQKYWMKISEDNLPNLIVTITQVNYLSLTATPLQLSWELVTK